ncbi:2-keto-4-pentenoate hydratase/2-oxohepta-3-ene-1,7-dioic acid hydratase in catechol pathway [Orbus hercynius]|uniref:2-keto-4-pentenoate hydratase/2-oxohepta-3-ene-1,7-dioic acid hydratase in catechol pathway n=1 Tax=Orbus hercynius TaxID=593135 RepID=A0A495RHW6_9GAMM|nr:fumarylacetoacetate hydrolase family protein [Orbus hercynius]RKS86900.1 2-keto-4-pentenoate hydratase/2-oxohepta-3-ene-1,7-dioic acid hydratase in catechol pathway [Orbus hercynius]
MKFISYSYNQQAHYGILTQQGIIDLTTRMGKQFKDLKSLLAAGALKQAQKYLHEPVDFSEADIEFLPVIVNPNKILCVGMNYADKRAEFEQTDPAPTLFVRFADSQTGHQCPLIKPAITNEFDYEGELAVIIGKNGMHISEQDALSHVAGYSCYMDGSVRDWQHTWFTAGKNWPKTGGFGPCLTTTDDIPDPANLTIATYLNGNQVQHDNTRNLVHKIPELIAYISTFTALSAGDVIITGSPGGVGKKRIPPLFMKAGDRIEVEIEKIGRLSNIIADEINPKR